MQFEEKPDYNYLRQLFKNIMSRQGHEADFQWDWTIKKQGGAQKLKEIIANERPEEVKRGQSKGLYDNREERKIATGQ